jgi:hypothetical protein
MRKKIWGKLMTIYTCELCGFTTDHKGGFNYHVNNRKKECSAKKQQKNKEINLQCQICGKISSRRDNLRRHMIKQHTTTDVIIKSYLDMNINDLTLSEQYAILTIGDNPYKNILDYLNFYPDKAEYHNIELRNLKSDTIYLHDGNKQIAEDVKIGIINIISTIRTLLCSIFNRFRIFMSSEFHKIQICNLYASLPCCKKEYKMLTSTIKRHLYNKKGAKEYPVVSENDPSFLARIFKWDDVEGYLTQMIEIGINFDLDLIDIYNTNVRYTKNCDNKVAEQKYFHKLLKRIKFLGMKYKDKKESSYGWDADEYFGVALENPYRVRHLGASVIEKKKELGLKRKGYCGRIIYK